MFDDGNNMMRIWIFDVGMYCAICPIKKKIVNYFNAISTWNDNLKEECTNDGIKLQRHSLNELSSKQYIETSYLSYLPQDYSDIFWWRGHDVG